MKRKDWIIIGGVAALAALLLVAGIFFKPKPDNTTLPTLTLTKFTGLDQSREALEEAESYLRIRQGDQYYNLIPLNGPGEIVITQEEQGFENVVRIDRNSVVMHNSNCPKHECMMQGEMTLDNINTRVFFQWIVCLPHQVVLELLPREEALNLLAGETP